MSIESTCKSRGLDSRLVRDIVQTLGGEREARETLRDVASHGADSGFPGFTYYADTSAFFRKHRRAIVSLVKSMANEFGQEPIAFVSSFRCLDADSECKESIGRCLYGGKLTDSHADTTVENALAWFALEETARALEK